MLARNTNAVRSTLISSLRAIAPQKARPMKLRNHVGSKAPVLSTFWRHKSSLAAYDDDDEDVIDATNGHAAAAALNFEKSHQESWMINLGRGNNNAWLSGPRTGDWFTGLAPSKCPGKLRVVSLCRYHCIGRSH